MAGRFAGISDVEWRLFEDIFPPAPPKRRRGMPHVPFRKLLHTLLSVLITGGRWCDVPRGPQGASKSATHRWWQRWQAEGTLAARQARILGLAEERGMIHGEYGAVDGALSPWEGWRRGRRPRGARQRDAEPQPDRGRRPAPGQPHHARHWGRAGPRAAVA
jgi:transposase